jgi:predicted Zn-dependent peptidase
VTGSEVLELDEIIERIDAVSAQDIQALAAELYPTDKLTAVAIGPDGKIFEAALDNLGGPRKLKLKVC